MGALRTRLLAALAAVLLATWGAGFVVVYLDVLERQSVEVDGMLRNVAEQMLQALPADITTAGQTAQFVLDDSTPADGKFGALGFQVWEHGSGRRLMSSRPAPAHAMAPAFADGFADEVVGGVPWRVYALSDADRRVQVQVGLPDAAMRAEMLRWLGGPTALAALLLLVGIGVAIWLVVHWSLRPVARMSEALAARSALDLAPLPERGLPDEIAPLVASFNQVLVRLDTALQHERAFLGEAAHELRTPLAALLAQAQVLQHAGDGDEAREALDRLVAGIERTSRLAQQLLDAARVEAGGSIVRARDVDLALVASMVADEFELVALRSGQTIEVEGAHAPVHGDIDDLGILVRNLLDNALRHSGPATRVRVRTGVEGTGPGRVTTLSVADDGVGIPEREYGQVFERFYRAGEGHRAQGIGMGLSLVQRVVASHGGQLRCCAGLEGRGFCVEIRLPSDRRL